SLRVIDGHSARDASARVLELFREVGLPDPPRHARQYPHELSGGMRQRVLIAMMLAREPALLIADEPTTALDATVQAQILTLLRNLARRRDMALLLITHDLNAVIRTAERAVVMQTGRVVEALAVTDLFTARHPYTRMLVEAMPQRHGAGSRSVEAGPDREAGHSVLFPSPESGVPLLAAKNITVIYPGAAGAGRAAGLLGSRVLGEPAVKG